MFSFISLKFSAAFSKYLCKFACWHTSVPSHTFDEWRIWKARPDKGSKETPNVSLSTIMLKQWWWFVRVQTYLGVFPPHIRAGVYLPTYYTYYLMLTGLLTNRCQDWKYFDKFGGWVLSDKLRPDSLCQRLTRLQIGRYFGSQTAFVRSKT